MMVIDGAVPIASNKRSSAIKEGGLPRFCPGTRRSFLCRMKTKNCRSNHYKEGDKCYRIVQCTGYLRSWASKRVGVYDDLGGQGMDSTDLLFGHTSMPLGTSNGVLTSGKF